MYQISYERPTNPRWKDITWEVFGRLTVVSFNHIKRSEKKNSYSYWNCICECGNETIVDSSALVSGRIVSCGCYNKERINERSITHGLSKHPVYRRANQEIQRCHNPNLPTYKDYGGRGITVYEPWRNDIGLMTRDILRLIGEPPTAKHQLDRPDNDRGYEPDNICWKTPEENNRNKRNNHHQSVDQITRTATRTYKVWLNLICRHKDEVCIEWIYDKNPDTDNGFKAFYRDMGEKPRHRSPIKRHDESKPFCKSNCYWG